MITWLPALLRIVGKNYKWYNECKCDKRMSPVMRLPNEKKCVILRSNKRLIESGG